MELRGPHSTPRVYATRGYVTHVRIRHPCTYVPPEYVYVMRTPDYVYNDTTRVRSRYACTLSPRCAREAAVRHAAHHSCTYSPSVYMYATRVCTTGGATIFVYRLIDFYAKEVVYHCRWERAEEREAHGVATCGSMQATP
jgi:hypothetical protein